MKILVVEPMKPCEVREIPDTMEAMQALVGGYIQAVYPFQEEVAVICNEKGRNLDLPYNRPLMDVRRIWEDPYGIPGLITIRLSTGKICVERNTGGFSMSDNMIKQITTDDLRRMEDQEGLILQGCGGDPQEWVDGINRELTEAGILLGGSKLENVVSFRHDGVTCLLFPFGDAELNIGKFAMWRIQTHDRYGGTWLSDYVPNRLGGFLHQPSRQKPTMSLIGMDGNIFAVMGKASSLLKEAGMGDLVSHMVQRVTTCGDYSKALNIISEYVETELSPPAIPQKSNKKKARNTYER